ncbi:hypothetical protein J2853_006940 [Streptosporangium lutulentum]|uniref:Uncharacterized protein n=1 Tax=Streptosporangium lutulentum TaxID=1461250 RepID=A0ABT9QNZ0_9ACTN|nr:hypothetical protein [Streptosporangium lutulentum]MDP9847729.1 hypothetical protein [Streptosporangium lutulentum]
MAQLVVYDPGMQMHVMPSVLMAKRATQGAFQRKTKLVRHSTRGGISDRMLQFQAMKSRFESPPHYLCTGASGNALAAGGRQAPVGDLRGAFEEVDGGQRDASDHFGGTGDGPAGILFGVPAVRPLTDPGQCFLPRGHGLPVPALDGRVSERLEHGGDIIGKPWPQGQFVGMENRLGVLAEVASQDDR